MTIIICALTLLLPLKPFVVIITVEKTDVIRDGKRMESPRWYATVVSSYAISTSDFSLTNTITLDSSHIPRDRDVVDITLQTTVHLNTLYMRRGVIIPHYGRFILSSGEKDGINTLFSKHLGFLFDFTKVSDAK